LFFAPSFTPHIVPHPLIPLATPDCLAPNGIR